MQSSYRILCENVAGVEIKCIEQEARAVDNDDGAVAHQQAILEPQSAAGEEG